jgi:plastocyanin
MRFAALLVLTATALGAAAAPMLGARGPQRVQVSALEFEYRLSRLSVKEGPALIELVNYGEDEHDLKLRRVGGRKTWTLRKLLPGSRATISLRLRPGTYRLWCAVADHSGRGMRATLRVKRS